jgi:hypothetical protein
VPIPQTHTVHFEQLASSVLFPEPSSLPMPFKAEFRDCTTFTVLGQIVSEEEVLGEEGKVTGAEPPAGDCTAVVQIVTHFSPSPAISRKPGTGSCFPGEEMGSKGCSL